MSPYPSNSDSVAQDQIKAFVERILRMREEAKAINDDIREIYAEAKQTGFDKTVLGKLVLYVEKRQTDAAAVAESESLFDLYLAAWEGREEPSRVHAREGQEWQPPAMASIGDQKDAFREGRPISQDRRFEHASVYFIAFPETGRIKVGVSNDVAQRLIDLSKGEGCTGEILHVMPGNRQAEMAAHNRLAAWRLDGEWFRDGPEVRAAIATHVHEKSHPVANVGEGASGADAAASDDPASREADDADRQQLAASGFTGGAAVASQKTLPDADGPEREATAANFQADPDKSAEVETSAAPVAPGKRRWNFTDKAHPDCLNPEQCGGFSNHGLCERCKAAA